MDVWIIWLDTWVIFFKFSDHDGGMVKVGNNGACHIKGIGSITLNRNNDTDDVYLFYGLKHNLLSVG